MHYFIDFVGQFRKKFQRKTVIGSIEEGLGMIDNENYFYALKVCRVKRICNADTASTWGYIPLQYTKTLNIWKVINLLNASNIKQIKLFKKIPIFYQ